MKKSVYVAFCCILLSGMCLVSAQDSETSPTASLENASDLDNSKEELAQIIGRSSHIQLIPLAQQTDSFIIGEGVQSVTASRTVDPFYMNAYETTYELWYKVRIFAETELGYVFQNPGQEGSSGRRARAPTENGKFQPATTISWRDAIVWCNALSEIEGRIPCYTYDGKILRDATDAAAIDLATCNWDADGYRLPTEAEWEYAARKIPTKTGTQSFTDGSSPSGPAWNEESILLAAETISRETNAPAFKPGTANIATANSLLGPQSTPHSGQANNSGLYDMSGNVLEFCWDWFAPYKIVAEGTRITGDLYGAERVSRGGSWSPYAPFLYAADRYAYDPSEAYNYMGFRFSTNTP